MIEILAGDFRELSKDIADDSVNLVMTDPPYKREFLHLWGDLGRISSRVLKPSGFLVSYSGQMFLPSVLERLSNHLSWYWLAGLQMDGGQCRMWARNSIERLKPILIFQKEPFRKQKKMFVNLIKSPAPSKEYHVWGQSVSPFRQLLEIFSSPGDLVFDPMTGAGTTGIACAQLDRRFIGHEIDEAMADVARERCMNYQPMLPLQIEERYVQTHFLKI